MAETENNPTEAEKKEEEKKEEPRALSQEDINKLIETARTQEKDKLYKTIDELKTQVTTLSEAQKNEKLEKEQLAEAAKTKLDEERQAKLSVEDRMAEQFKKLEERLAKEEAERIELKAELAQERDKTELERYKHELLETAGDEILKELVRGTTKAEIAASIDVAKAKYQDYFQAAVKNAEGDPGRKIKEAGGKLPKPANPDPDPMDEEGLKGLIPQIDPYASGSGKVSEEYKKNRDQILARVENAYKKSATR